MSELTPLMKQYFGIKEQYRDAVLLFRLGDFYEMFGDDARIASRILQIALTTRDKNRPDPTPMCGIPHFAADNYISKLIKAGLKVAICEQMEDPKDAKGIVKREVTRVLTPGTYAPDNPKQNNYLMALSPKGEKLGIAIADVSTGEMIIFESQRALEDEVGGYGPSEVIIPEGLSDNIHYREALADRFVSTVEEWKFGYSEAYRSLLQHFRVASLDGFGVEGMTAGISAGGGLLAYLKDAHQDTVTFRKISTVTPGTHMFVDAATIRNLELTANMKDNAHEGTLLWALDETLTPMGGRFLRSALLRPLISIETIRQRHHAVKYLVDAYDLAESLRLRLRNVFDIERLAQRISTGSAHARDLASLRQSLALMPEVRAHLKKTHEPHLKSLGESVGDFGKIESLIAKSIVDHPPASLRDGGIIREGFHAEIDELRGLSTNTKDFIASLEADERKQTGISSLKVGYNRIHGYYIEVTKANFDLVPERYIRKQTLVGAERFVTPELKEHENKVLGAEERLKALEFEVFTSIVAEIRESAAGLMKLAALIAELDFLISMSVVAKRHNYAMPHMTEAPVLDIVNGRHPVIERLMPGVSQFIPNDTHMNDTDYRLLVITGPNMAGKSTYMRQVALIVLMAQMGSFVPAESAEIGVSDRIFTRIGASDYLSRGQSTFMVEMVETANILNNASPRSLIVLDEVGRGTSTFDGISIAWATAEHIAREIKARTLFATHYIELTELSREMESVKNFNIQVKEWGDEIIFLRKIEPGPADKSYGIQVARLAGLPASVLGKAREVLKELEKQHLGSAPRTYRQLDLFAGLEGRIMDELMEIDPEIMTYEELRSAVRALQNKGKAL